MVRTDQILDSQVATDDRGPGRSRRTAVEASSQPWNSATTFYIARTLDAIANGRGLDVLDLGCGDGRTISLLHQLGHEMHGVDLPDRADVLRRNLLPVFGDRFETKVRIVTNERCIPFESRQFDVVYANQVFEHVRFLDQMLAECARVLRPDGVLIALFPTATYPIEGHALVPFVHWIPPGAFRRSYLRVFLSLGIGRTMPGLSVKESAREWDERLRLYTFYRFINEIEDLFRFYFEEFSIDTGEYVRAKLDLLGASPSSTKRIVGHALRRVQGRLVSALITHGFGAAFVASRPKPEDRRNTVVSWRH
jgi:SAM-dependent methyltransferase